MPKADVTAARTASVTTVRPARETAHARLTVRLDAAVTRAERDVNAGIALPAQLQMM